MHKIQTESRLILKGESRSRDHGDRDYKRDKDRNRNHRDREHDKEYHDSNIKVDRDHESYMLIMKIETGTMTKDGRKTL